MSRPLRARRAREQAEASRAHDPPPPQVHPMTYCSCGEALSAGLCPFLGRCREPLAWSLDAGSVAVQGSCPLFTRIPKELRDMIWEYALTDCTSNPLVNHRAMKLVRQDIPKRSPDLSATTSDAALSLLETCRAVYLETYILPLTCNPFVIQGLYVNKSYLKLYPWQFAAVQSLDITLMQTLLEGKSLKDCLSSKGPWDISGRHKGVYVAPQYYRTFGRGGALGARATTTHSFTFVRANDDPEPLKLWPEALEQAPGLSDAENLPKSCTIRVALARPLTHLTLRLNYMDWWTWTEPPDTADETRHLGLDPTCGDGNDHISRRATCSRMRSLADERRAGHPIDTPSSALHAMRSLVGGGESPGWGSLVGSLPDLKSLELVLETPVEKTAQLDNVAECAKTWRFPITGTQHVLVWDGKVEEGCWNKVPTVQPMLQEDAPWYSKCYDFEVRVVRFKRRKV